VIAIAAQRNACTAKRQQRRRACLRIEAEGPFQPRSERRARVELRLVAQRQAGVGGLDDSQILGDKARNAGPCGYALGGGAELAYAADFRIATPRCR
jgi:hypothetical protein